MMGFDQKESTVFCVKQSNAGKWDVCEEGFEKPLASFDRSEDAKKYAQELADTKEGSRVKIDE